MHLSKTEFFALFVLMITGFYFYTQHQLASDDEIESSQAPMLLHPGRTPVIVAFGDSLTAGSGVPADESYPSQLSNMLGIDVINAGRPLELSRDAAKRIAGVMKRYHPDIVLVETGLNDLLTGRKRSQLRENLTKIVETVKKGGATPVIIGIPDMDLIGLMISSDIGLYDEVAEKTGAGYIPDVFGPVLKDESLMSDDVHPNARGYKKAAQTVNEFLRGLLQ